MPTDDQQNFLAELGLGDLEGAERDELLESIGEVLFQGVMLRVFEVLNEEEQDALSVLFDASNADPDNEEKRDELHQYIAEHVPQFDAFLGEEIALLKKAYEENRGALENTAPSEHESDGSE